MKHVVKVHGLKFFARLDFYFACRSSAGSSDGLIKLGSVSVSDICINNRVIHCTNFRY